MKKKSWWKPAIEAKGSKCLCCGETAELLDLNTKLYNGFGGWVVMKNGQEYFQEENGIDFDEGKDLKHVENMIGEDTENLYEAVVYLPLRGATYQRHAKNNWVLIETNEGFA